MSELGRPHTEEAAYCSFLRVSRSQCQFRLSIVIDVTKESLCFELMCVCGCGCSTQSHKCACVWIGEDRCIGVALFFSLLALLFLRVIRPSPLHF